MQIGFSPSHLNFLRLQNSHAFPRYSTRAVSEGGERTTRKEDSKERVHPDDSALVYADGVAGRTHRQDAPTGSTPILPPLDLFFGQRSRRIIVHGGDGTLEFGRTFTFGSPGRFGVPSAGFARWVVLAFLTLIVVLVRDLGVTMQVILILILILVVVMVMVVNLTLTLTLILTLIVVMIASAAWSVRPGGMRTTFSVGIDVDGTKVLKDVVPIPAHDVLNLIVVAILVMMMMMMVIMSPVLVLVLVELMVMIVMLPIIMPMRSPRYVLVTLSSPTATTPHVLFLLLQRGRHVSSAMAESLDDPLQGLFDVDVHLEVQLSLADPDAGFTGIRVELVGDGVFPRDLLLRRHCRQSGGRLFIVRGWFVMTIVRCDFSTDIYYSIAVHRR